MIATLRAILGAACNENLSIIRLNRAEADWDIEVNVEQLARLLVDVDEVVVDRALVEFEIMDAIGRLTDALTVIAEAGSTVDLRDGPLHQVTLVAHQLVAGAIRHRLHPRTESSAACVTTLLQIRS